MTAELVIARLMSDYQDIWLRHFPGRFRRAEWHILHYVYKQGRTGASVAEVYGLARQIFLLDDATVRERVLSLTEAGLLNLDGLSAQISARNIVTASANLVTAFDSHLTAFAHLMLAAAHQIDPEAPAAGGLVAAAATREALSFVEAHERRWRAALEAFFDETGLSHARRLEARRQLLSTSHAALVRMALEHDSAGPGRGKGLAADRMASRLLELTGQNFQTTRDHIAYLLALGMLERRTGKALHVGVAPNAAGPLRRELGALAPALLAAAQAMTRTDGSGAELDIERTLNVRALAVLRDAAPRLTLTVTEPREERRQLTLSPDAPLTIGRAPTSGLVLSNPKVSRTHCRVDVNGAAARVADLNSTNGTFVDGVRVNGLSAELRPGAVMTIGPYRLMFEREASAPFAVQKGTNQETR